jgi:hypothetical protein
VIVLAIPAPQAALLLENSHITTMPELRSIVYDPCLTVMAGYGASLPAVAPSTAIAWLGLDSSHPLIMSLLCIVVEILRLNISIARI